MRITKYHNFALFCLFLQITEVDLISYLVSHDLTVQFALDHSSLEIPDDSIVVIVDGSEEKYSVVGRCHFVNKEVEDV